MSNTRQNICQTSPSSLECSLNAYYPTYFQLANISICHIGRLPEVFFANQIRIFAYVTFYQPLVDFLVHSDHLCPNDFVMHL
jgi:hypothetical protein